VKKNALFYQNAYLQTVTILLTSEKTFVGIAEIQWNYVILYVFFQWQYFSRTLKILILLKLHNIRRDFSTGKKILSTQLFNYYASCYCEKLLWHFFSFLLHFLFFLPSQKKKRTANIGVSFSFFFYYFFFLSSWISIYLYPSL
jgi:hypothetical protein